MNIEVDVDAAIGALTTSMVRSMGVDAARAYLRGLLEKEEFWEALRLIDARGIEEFGREVMGDVLEEARINVAIDSVRPKAKGS